MCLYVFGIGIVVWLLVCGMLTLGVFFHILEILTLYCVELGIMGWVSMCVFVNCCNICFSVCGVRTFGLSVAWLCMHMIDVSAGSSYW